jgi:hypothetical protein
MSDRIILCEPLPDCADAHVLRWHCMRGHDGAPAGICPLKYCDRQGANRGRAVPSAHDDGAAAIGADGGSEGDRRGPGRGPAEA